MEYSKTISGPEAVERMRNLKLIPGATFMMKFITCDLNRPDKTGNVDVYQSCRLRPARSSEGLSVDSDLYIYFSDESTGEPRQCFKILVRAVSFPPKYEWQNVSWLNE